jgi:hypothetical protein
MSTIEHRARIEAPEQDPELLSQVVALDWESVSGESTQQSDPDAQIQAKWSALDWPDPEPLGGELPAVQAFDRAL